MPESYVDTFDDVVAEGYKTGAGMSLEGAKRVLEGSALAPDVRNSILGIVLPGGEDSASSSGVGRAEFSVLLALVGLAQEGEEVSLDSVDERRRSMFVSELRYHCIEINKEQIFRSQSSSSDSPNPSPLRNLSKLHPRRPQLHAQNPSKPLPRKLLLLGNHHLVMMQTRGLAPNFTKDTIIPPPRMEHLPTLT